MTITADKTFQKSITPPLLSIVKVILFFWSISLFSCASIQYAPNGKEFFSSTGQMHAKVENGTVVINGIPSRHKYDGIRRDSVKFSKNEKHFAYIGMRNGKYFIVVDGNEMGPFDDHANNWILFDSTGENIALVLIKDKKWVVKRNGAEGKAYDNINKLIFSEDGEDLVYIARQDNKWMVVKNGLEGPKYDGITSSTPILSPDGEHLIYGALLDDKWLIVQNGIEGPKYDGILSGTPILSPDGEYLIYGALLDDKWMIVQNGIEGPKYDGILLGTPVTSPNFKHIIYGGLLDDKWLVVRNGVAGPAFEDFLSMEEVLADKSNLRIFSNSLVLSQDYNHMYYGGLREKKWVIMQNEIAGEEFDAIFHKTLVFSDDNQHIAYKARKGRKHFVVKDDTPEIIDDAQITTDKPVLSADGKTLVYSATRNNKWMVVKNGVEGKLYDGILSGTPILSSDGQHLIYGVLQDDKWHIVRNGIEDPACEGILIGTPVISPDGQHYGYGALRGKQWVMVRNGSEVQAHDRILKSSLYFTPDNQLIYASRDEKKWRIHIDEKISEPFDSILDPGLIVCPNKKRVAIIGKRDGEFIANVDGKEDSPYQDIKVWKTTHKTGTSRSAPFAAEVALNVMTALLPTTGYTYYSLPQGPGRKVIRTYSSLKFSPDSKHYAYLATREKRQFIVVDGKEIHELPEGSKVETLKFSDNSDVVMYKLKYNKVKDWISVNYL